MIGPKKSNAVFKGHANGAAAVARPKCSLLLLGLMRGCRVH